MTRALHSHTYKRLRRSLQQARADAGMTQAQVAARMRRPQSFVSKIENGERHINVVEFIQLCRAIGVAPSDVMAQFDDLTAPDAVSRAGTKR